jgi:hypothetical protein
LAVLVITKSELDQAVIATANWAKEINKNLINCGMSNEYQKQIKITGQPDGSIKKRFRLYEFWTDPLIPIYLNEDRLKKSKKPCTITYLKYKARSINTLNDIYNPIIELINRNYRNNLLALFSGFGLYEIIVIIEHDNYSDVHNTIYALRGIKNNDKFILSDSMTLISISTEDIEIRNNIEFNIVVKIKPGFDLLDVWDNVKKDASSILETADIHYTQGFYDVGLSFKSSLDRYVKFMDILSCLPWVIDTATTLKGRVVENK